MADVPWYLWGYLTALEQLLQCHAFHAEQMWRHGRDPPIRAVSVPYLTEQTEAAGTAFDTDRPSSNTFS
jgi:hypothetical protein